MTDESSTKTEEKFPVSVSGRSNAPVFVLGSPRSGTTLLYHMLLSSGGFAVYRSETHVFNLLETAYGDLSKASNKRKLMKAWLESKLFQVSGLDARKTEARVIAECTNGGDFLRLVMGQVAQNQNVKRWADCTPDHLLYLRRIKETIPEALIIHIIRDGRDVALSMEKQRWIRPLPGSADQRLTVAALYWEWIVNRGRETGSMLAADYCEVHFEDLIREPRSVLGRLSAFIDHDLNYDRIHEVGIGSVLDPNSSFHDGASGEDFNPVARWRQALQQQDLIRLESLIGGTLRELGYPVGAAQPSKSELARLRKMRARYRKYFAFKLWLKTRTPIGKWLVTKDLSWL
jgi:sulfotransferase family protein